MTGVRDIARSFGSKATNLAEVYDLSPIQWMTAVFGRIQTDNKA